MMRASRTTWSRWVAAILGCTVLGPAAVSCESGASPTTHEASTTSTIVIPVPDTAVPKLRAPDGANHVTVDSQNPAGTYALQFYIGTDGPFTLAVGLARPGSFERGRAAAVAAGATATEVAGAPAYQSGCTVGGPTGAAPTGDASLHWTRGAVEVALSAPISKDCAFDGPNATAIRQLAATVSDASEGDWYGSN